MSLVRPTVNSARLAAANNKGMYQIGEVAARVGLSLRTVRYYEEVGLLSPAARTQGRFRLFTDEDTERLLVIMQMKPSGFSLEQMRDLLNIRDDLRAADLDASGRAALVERLNGYAALSIENVERLRRHLAFAEELVHTLHNELQAAQE
jgi:MerR family copper efflux transcriptional regulator